MGFNNRRYVVFNLSESSIIDFSEVLETSVDTLRKNQEETQSFVKYAGEMPSSVSVLTTKSEEYSQEELLALLREAEWNDTNPEP